MHALHERSFLYPEKGTFGTRRKCLLLIESFRKLNIDGLVKSLKIANIQFSHPVISMGYEIDF